METCVDCGENISGSQVNYCDVCGDPLCEDCSVYGLCLRCFQLMEEEVDLEDDYFEDLE